MAHRDERCGLFTVLGAFLRSGGRMCSQLQDDGATPEQYERLDLDQLVREINEEHHAAEQAMRDGVDHARRAGQLLLHVKDKLMYGEFMPWVERNCDFSHRT